jgi:hypothetical protein
MNRLPEEKVVVEEEEAAVSFPFHLRDAWKKLRDATGGRDPR